MRWQQVQLSVRKQRLALLREYQGVSIQTLAATQRPAWTKKKPQSFGNGASTLGGFTIVYFSY